MGSDRQNIIDTDNQELQNALQIIQYTNHSLFLTGKAGTGKSTFLRHLANNTKKKHVVLAPTGIAAISAGWSTLHSFFKLPFYPLLPNDTQFNARNIRKTLKYNQEKIKMLRELDLIIIDEISMVRADIIDFIDKVLRIYCQNMRTPFGGKQLLLVGDMFQLEPVVTDDEKVLLRQFYPNSLFFNAHVFREMRLVSIELKKVYRQNDAEFISLLDNIRTSCVTAFDMQRLNQRVGKPTDSDGMSITLSTRRDTVDYINQARLAQLDGDIAVYEGVITGEFPESSLPSPKRLELKLGAQILFVRNDKDHQWVNGTLGMVTGFDMHKGTEKIQIHTDRGDDVEVEREVWSNTRYTFNETEKKIEEEEIGTYTQFPLKLAWAITVHKSQGLTFKNVNIDFSGGAFAGGQTYVALSRCQTLEGICLQEPIRRSDIFVKPEVRDFATSYNDKSLINNALKQSQADKYYNDAAKAFDRGDMQAALASLFIAIHSRYDIEKPAPRRLLRMKLNIVNTLRREVESLRNTIAQREGTLKRFASEYVSMGKMCEREGMRDAAIRNYKKALELCPDHQEAKRRLKKLKK